MWNFINVRYNDNRVKRKDIFQILKKYLIKFIGFW